MDAEKRLQELHLTLPTMAKPMAVYKPTVQVGNLLYLSGQVPVQNDGSLIKGKVGDGGLTLEQGHQAARQVALTMLASIKGGIGSLNKIKRLVKTLGMVNSSPTFYDHPKVINGFSELMRDVFGEDAGVGARSAVGVASLPSNVAVEVEAIFELN